jgi:acetyltransferase-like isoleucine patch superfamily enzyme
MRNSFILLFSILPNFLKLFAYRRFLGWSIGENVKIGFSYIDAKNVVIGDRVRIGHGNLIRNLNILNIGNDAFIANFNSVFGSVHPGWVICLEIGQSVSFMSHHFVDVWGTVKIGDYSTIAGRDTHVWSHTLVHDAYGANPSLQSLDVSIGAHVYVGARSTLVGCAIPDRTVVGAGSVVTKQFAAEATPYLIAGNPAIIKKRYQSNPSELVSVND